MGKKKAKLLSILFTRILPCLVLMSLGLPGPILSAAGQTASQPSTGEETEKLTADDLALHIYDNGTGSIHVRKANTGYKYALLNSSGEDLSGWQDPEAGRVIFENQETGKGYSVVFSPDEWTTDITPDDWAKTAIHFDLPDYDDAIEKTFVNPQDVERSKDGTIIWIYSTHQDCEYALYEYYSDELMTEWKPGTAGVVVFTGLKPYLDYNVRARITGTGPKPEIIPDKTLPEPGADVIVGECSFDDLSGYGLIHIWAAPGHGYALLGADKKPLSEEQMAQWNVFVKDQYEQEIYPDNGYYQIKEGGRITFSVPAGGSYHMGVRLPDGETTVSNQVFQVKSVNKNYWYEYVIPKGKSREEGFYRLVIYPACPEVVYKLSAIHSFIHFIDRYEKVKPGGEHRVIFSPVNGFLEFVITAQPIPLTLTGSPEEELFGDDLWGSSVWTGDVSGGDVSSGDVPAGDVSGGDMSGGNVSGGDIVVRVPPLLKQFVGLTEQEVSRSSDGKEITVEGTPGQQYALADPISNELLSSWCDAENGEVNFHSLDPAAAYLILAQLPATENSVCVFQPEGVYVPGTASGGGDVSGGDVSGGDVSGGDVGGGDTGGGSDGEGQAVHLTAKMYQSINGGDSSILDQSVQFGDSVRYTLVAENYGDSDTSQVVITDQIPEGMLLQEGSISGGGVYDSETRTITWKPYLDRFDAENGAGRVSLQFQVTVESGRQKTSYSNRAYVEQTGAAIDTSNTVYASTPAITIAKKTAGASKNPQIPFLFTMHLIPPQGCEIDPSKIVCTNGTTTFSKTAEGDYVAHFWLSDRQLLKFIGLPEGTQYRVEERRSNMDRYTTTVKDVTGTVVTDEWGDQYAGTGTVPSDGTDVAVLFLNTWQ